RVPLLGDRIDCLPCCDCSQPVAALLRHAIVPLVYPVLLRLQTTSTRIHDVLAGSVAQNRHWLFHPCFATRLGGVSGGREAQGGRASAHRLMVGAGNFGSAKLPMATATYPGKLSPSQ